MRQFTRCVSIILASLSTIHAQTDVNVLPTCALPCISVGLSQTSCSQTDVRCLCQSSGYIDAAATCIRSLCNEADRLRAYNYSKDTCSVVGIDVSIPSISSSTASSVSSATGLSMPTATDPGAASTTSTNSASRTRPSSDAAETSTGNQNGSNSSGTPTPGSSNSGSSAPIGAIVGGIVGGVVAIVAVVILGVWLLKREKRKKMEMQLQIASGNLPPKPPMQADANSQGIWDGNNAFSWNPQTNVHDVQGGVPNDR
ncbi:hypothetical protein TWF281_006171 [Arthrobotrys megalospora]